MGIDRPPALTLIFATSTTRCMTSTNQESAPSSSREFVKQSSLYQEFLAEREEILKILDNVNPEVAKLIKERRG